MGTSPGTRWGQMELKVCVCVCVDENTDEHTKHKRIRFADGEAGMAVVMYLNLTELNQRTPVEAFYGVNSPNGGRAVPCMSMCVWRKSGRGTKGGLRSKARDWSRVSDTS